jgi:hypothetical protein
MAAQSDRGRGGSRCCLMLGWEGRTVAGRSCADDQQRCGGGYRDLSSRGDCLFAVHRPACAWDSVRSFRFGLHRRSEVRSEVLAGMFPRHVLWFEVRMYLADFRDDSIIVSESSVDFQVDRMTPPRQGLARQSEAFRSPARLGGALGPVMNMATIH